MCFNQLYQCVIRCLMTNLSDLAQRQQRRRLERRLFKDMPAGWGKDPEDWDELAAAKDSYYYWWWAFLRESDEYRQARKGQGTEAMLHMAADFGQLGDHFPTWWFKRGRDIFAEKMAFPQVRKLQSADFEKYESNKNKLLLEIPLTIRRSTLLRQINKILDTEHAGAALRLHKFSEAQRRIYPKQRIRKTTFKPILDVWHMKKSDKHMPDWQIGEQLRLSPSFIVAAADDADTTAYKHRNMALTVQRLLRKAQALIKFAARGEFPRFR